MSESKITNCLLGSIVVLTALVFSWTFVYVNDIATQENNVTVVSAFDA